METEISVQLAGDVLKEHFGGAVQRVGDVLLRRGALSLQEIVRFAGEVVERGEEPLRFPHVRNALLTLVQHGLVTARAHPQASNNDALRALLQVYSIDMDEVLARLRFPQFLEHCYWHYGDLAYELLKSALRYGRVAASAAIAEAKRAVGGVTEDELEAELRRLVEEGLLRRADLCAAAPSASSSSTAPAPGGDAGGGAGGALQPIADRETANGVEPGSVGGLAARAAEPSSSSTAPQAGQAVPFQPQHCVYRYNRRALNLGVCKNLVCRLVEEMVNDYASKVLAALLTGVSPIERGEGGVEVQYLKFHQLEKKMQDLGALQAGRDPVKEREKLAKYLDLLASQKDGLIKKRMVQVAAGSIPRVGGAEPDGAAAEENGRPAKTRRTASAPLASGGTLQTEQVAEWAAGWEAARRLLKNTATSQLIRDQFGAFGLRIFNLLNETPQQRMEEPHILSTCMIPLTEGREVLNEMVRRSVIHWQEVPRSANTPLQASFWLYYVDPRRLDLSLLWIVMQAVMNLRVRFRAEMTKLMPLESRRDSLTKKERLLLHQGMRTEDILERSFLVLDAALLVFRWAF